MGTFLKYAVACAVLALVVAVGLERSLPTYNIPRDYRIRLQTNYKGHYTIQVRASQMLVFPVTNTSETVIHVPKLPRTCSWDWFCFTIIDGSPKTRHLVHVLRNGKILRRYSVSDLDLLQSTNGTVDLKL